MVKEQVSTETALHTKYRPTFLDEVLGHTKVVTQLKGVVNDKKFPSAILLTGPSSVGKTTLARAFASTVLGKKAEGHPDFYELNASESRGIDDIRELISLSRLRPTSGIRRFIFVDEGQGLLSSPAAAACFLKPLEQPPKTTTWIIGSMDPEKFQTTSNGKAIANRCVQFALSQPSKEELFAYGKRIVKGEGLGYFTKEVLDLMVEGCNSEMRSLANMIQSSVQYYEGLETKPDKLSADDVSEVLKVSGSEDDATAVRLLGAIYAKKFSVAQKEILNIQDGFGFINKMLYLNWFLLNNTVLKGAKHPKLWGNRNSFALVKVFQSIVEQQGPDNQPDQVKMIGQVQDTITQLKYRAQAFALPEQMAISNAVFTLVQQLKGDSK